MGELKDTLELYIASFYKKHNLVPKEVIVPSIIDDKLFNEILDTKVVTVKRGSKKKLFDMAYNNAKSSYEKEIKLIYNNEELTSGSNEELRKLHLSYIFFLTLNS